MIEASFKPSHFQWLHPSAGQSRGMFHYWRSVVEAEADIRSRLRFPLGPSRSGTSSEVVSNFGSGIETWKAAAVLPIGNALASSVSWPILLPQILFRHVDC